MAQSRHEMAHLSRGVTVRGSYTVLKYGRRRVNAAISIPKTIALKARAVSNVDVVAELALAVETSDLGWN